MLQPDSNYANMRAICHHCFNVIFALAAHLPGLILARHECDNASSPESDSQIAYLEYHHFYSISRLLY